MPVKQAPLPVLVVGNGPVGLLTALALAKQDVEVILVSRHMRRLGVPKAHALSPRSLEICRQLGLPVGEIRRLPAHRNDARWVRFMTNCSGQLVGTLPYENMGLDVLDHTPEMVHNVAQPDLEAIMEYMLDAEVNVDYRLGWTWISHEEVTRNGETICVSTVEDTYTGEEMRIESSLVVGCDGANSRVRKAVGITSEGEETADTMITIHFSADLRPVVGDKVGMLYWILDPEARGFIISYDIEYNHVLIHNIDPEVTPLATFTPEKCMDIVRAAIGRDVPVDFNCSMPWILRRKVANNYYRGRAVLAGDSAHSFPPTGGLGLNSGIADGHNLAYKIAAAYHGWGHLPSLLKSYEGERRPVALHNSIQSVKNGKKIFHLLKALRNTSPDIQTARAEMMAALRDPKQLSYVQALIQDQAEHFDNLDRHLGYIYEPGWTPQQSQVYKPQYRRGARFAHAWVKSKTPGVLPPLDAVDLSYLDDLPASKAKDWNFSVLDVVAHGQYTFFYSGSTWGKKVPALRQLFAQQGVPLKVVEAGKDFEFTEKKPGKAWMEGYGINKNGAVLVRPDQHVQCVVAGSELPQRIINDVLRTLGRQY
ncbi:hypothetical protein CspeluHIS016_0602970 [Cutaneotrichosporon spelunceum]|uniref:FAD-binding domain-containing protein n=1 Tax=Cutaneotrichosporon spelunceum TaxID=1672016 RepID=A0AAD3TYL6_9TREE|nr:hypothetical protein CspeluHIS016_0602970 [Cutaneotrichosporon spelunceum]